MATILPHVLKRALSLVISTNEEGKVDDCTTLSPSSTLDTRLGVVIKTPLPISIFEEGKDKDGLSFEGRKNVSNQVQKYIPQKNQIQIIAMDRIDVKKRFKQ